MSKPNPILDYAKTVNWRTDMETLLFDIHSTFYGTEVYQADVEEAVEAALVPTCPTPYLEAVVRVCLLIVMSAKQKDVEARIHFDAGSALYQRFDEESLQLAVAHFGVFQELLNTQGRKLAFALVKESVARCKLAEMGIDPLENANAAARSCSEAQQILDDSGALHAEALMVEGAAHVLLARGGFIPKKRLLLAVACCERAREFYDKLEPEGHNAAVVRGHVAVARCRTAEFGIEPRKNYAEAARLFSEARRIYGYGSHNDGSMAANEGLVRVQLADMGEDPKDNLREAVRLFQRSRQILDSGAPQFDTEYGRALVNEGLARDALGAELGDEPIDNLQEAVRLYNEARAHFRQASPDHVSTLTNEAAARMALADYGMESEDNYTRAASLYEQARNRCSPDGPEHQLAALGEVNARIGLAGKKIALQDRLAEINRSFALLKLARANVAPDSMSFCDIQNAEAAVWQEKADCWKAELKLHTNLYEAGLSAEQEKSRTDFLAGEVREALEQVIHLRQQARSSLPIGSVPYAESLQNEAAERLALADWGVDSDENLQAALGLTNAAIASSAVSSFPWCKAQSLRAAILRMQGATLKAYEGMKKVLEGVEGLRARMRREKERISFLEDLRGWYTSIVGVCLDLAASASSLDQATRWRWEAWHWVHRHKSRALLDLLGNVRPRLAASDLPLWEECNTLRQQFDQVAQSIAWLQRRLDKGKEEMPPFIRSEAMEKLGILEAQREQLLQVYDQKRRALVEQAEEALILQAVDVLPPEKLAQCLRELANPLPGQQAASQDARESAHSRRALLVEFFLLDHDEVVVFLLPLWDNLPLTVEQIAVKHSSVFLLTRSLLEALDRLQQGTQGGAGSDHVSSGAGSGSPHQVFEHLPEAMSALIDPWGNRLEELAPTELIVSPHTFLSLLPLHAALWKGKPLIEHFPVVYLPSPALAPEIVRRPGAPSGEALLLGNPTGGLVSSEAEVEDVGNWLTTAGLIPRVFVRDQATAERIYAFAAAASLYHFACHSVLDRSDFLQSGIELADGRLTIREVAARLEFKRAVLAFLNSCDSGRVVSGFTDELLAMVRVFLYAGCPTVIATLWPLDESAGSYFAGFFYKFWSEDNSTVAQAFQKAMMQLRAEYNNPYLWAPFVLMGDWQAYLKYRDDVQSPGMKDSAG